MPKPTLRDAYCRWCGRMFQVGIDDTLDQHLRQCDNYGSVEFDKWQADKMKRWARDTRRDTRRSPR